MGDRGLGWHQPKGASPAWDVLDVPETESETAEEGRQTESTKHHQFDFLH